MPTWFWIAFWWLAFAATHLFLSSIPIRRIVIGRVGAPAFAGIYSLVALATFVPLTIAYWGNRHTGPALWSMYGVAGARAVAISLALLGFALIAASFVQPSAAGMDPRAGKRAVGITRITRHPLFVGLALWALAHVLINGFLSDLIFFGGFIVFGIVGSKHQDDRKLAESPGELGDFYRESSFLPFAAILAGRNYLAAGELPWLGLAAGAAVGVGFYLLHPWMFGG